MKEGKKTFYCSERFLSEVVYGGFAIPLSVIIAVTRSLGVISKAGWAAVAPSGVIRLLFRFMTSFSERCSMGISSPELRDRSSVEMGAAT